MKLKISSPEKVVYEWEVKQVSIPTETGIITVLPNHIPMVTALKPWIIKIVPTQDASKEFVFSENSIQISVWKWMVFVDGKTMRIVTAVATTSPESEDILSKMKLDLEDKIKELKKKWSIEEIEKSIIKLEKINADMKLQRLKMVH